jgi:predicted AAA+ superfamily ATPase
MFFAKFYHAKVLLIEKFKFSGAKINYWRTKSGSEIDFIVDYGLKILPIEVKFKAFKKPQISRGLRSFIKKYKPEKAFVINKTLNMEIKVESTIVTFIPFYLFPLVW